MTRRRLLETAALTPALLGLAGRAAARPGQESGQAPDPAKPAPSPDDEFGAFLARWVPRAHAFVAEEAPDEDAFLYELCAELVRCEPGLFPKRRFTVYDGEGMKTGPLGRDDVFQLVELTLEPGTLVPAHNHVAYAFATLCLEGEVRVRHYEPEPGSPGPLELEQDFLAREVQELLLRTGQVATLTRTRANVHALRAGPEGARLLDFGLKFPSKGDGPGAFSVLELDPAPADAERGTHTARWIGNVYAHGYERKR